MAFQPISMKNCDLLLGAEGAGTDYAIQCTGITCTPDVATERLKTLKKEGRYSSVDDPEWSMEVSYAFGKDSEGGVTLSDYLLENNGVQVPFTFRPISGGPPVYSGTVTLVAGGFGGDQGAFSTQSVTLPIEGQIAVDRTAVPAG